MKIFSKQGFVISDSCYVLSEDVYLSGKKKKFADGIFEVNGYSFAVGSTAHGDGVHYDNACHKYSVDSGAIGLIPLELVSKKEGLGAVFELPSEAEFYCEDGIFDIFLSDGQNIYINTRYEENDS